MSQPSRASNAARPLLICFSHLRFDFVYQRPQHLMSRFARTYDVLFFEEPVHDAEDAWLEVRTAERNIHVLIPHLPSGCENPTDLMRDLLDTHLEASGREPTVLWYYTPMSLPYSAHLPHSLVVYDCMDELSAFRG